MKFENTHILIGVLVIIGVGILYYIFAGKPIHNEGIVNVTENTQPATGENINDVNALIDKLNAEEIQQHPITPDEENVEQPTLDKLRWKNQATGKRVESSYATGTRANAPADEWDDFYKTNTDLIDKSYIQSNDKFLPVDETRGNLANYAGKGLPKQTPEDLFKVDRLLPQEANPDWFEVMPEPIKVKNRHLVNVTRPVGVNTIGGSHKNASYDLRGSPPCPKFVVSPWMNSSISPDLNIKGLN